MNPSLLENLVTDSLHVLRLLMSCRCWQNKSALGGPESRIQHVDGEFMSRQC